MKLIPTLFVPAALLCAALPIQAQAGAKTEAAAIRVFKKDFRPSAKALDKAMQGAGRLGTSLYNSKLRERQKVADGWKEAVAGLEGFGSGSVAKAIANGWGVIDREVGPMWKERAKMETRIDREYQKLMKLTGGKAVLPGQQYPPKVIAAQQVFLGSCRRSSEIRRNITDMTTLRDSLRMVVAKMSDPDGISWLLKNVVGSKRHPLVLKVESIKAAGRVGEPLMAEMISAFDRAKKPDELAALSYGIGLLGDKAKAVTPRLIELLTHDDSGVREHAALALQHMKEPASIEPLIRLVAREEGHARKRIVAVLEILTGQQHGENVSVWQSWFAAEGADYAAGKVPLGNGTPSAHEKYNKENYYYDIPQDGKGIVYVIDCSGSMVVDKDNPEWGNPSEQRDPRPAKDPASSRSGASKAELRKALHRLTSNQRFNIVWYNHAAALYKKKMVPATPENVEAAVKFVSKLPADSSTNIYDAMQMAFTLVGRGSYDKHYGVEFDTIFLLTDGKPTLQGLGDDDPDKIVEGVREWNAMQRVVVHTIAMGDKGIDHDFLRQLAGENKGEYRQFVKGKVVGGKAKAKDGGEAKR